MNTTANVYALLGKKLRNEKPPREFQWRIAALCEFLEKDTATHVALLGKGESTEALRELHRRKASLPERPFIDEYSKNSIGNFRVLGGYLTSLLCHHDAIDLTIVSSDYHLDRIAFVDRHLEPQSLVNELPSVIRVKKEPLWKACDYRSHVADKGIATRFAKIYVAGELLMPLRINLEGLLAGRLNRLVRGALERYKDGLSAVGKQLSLSRDGLSEQAKSDLEEVENWLTQLASHNHRSNQLAGSMSPCIGEDELKELTTSIGRAINCVRDLCDPDQQKFDCCFGEGG